MIRIDNTILDSTTNKAKQAARRRMNHNFHPVLEDPLQRMLNAMEPGTYIQPHKHEDPDKTEVFMVLRGRIMVVEYNDNGEIVDCELLDANNGKYGAEIPARTWHSIISLEPGSVAFEIKDGPYNPIDDKNFASWAPKEGEPDVENYLNRITEECLQRIN